VFDRDEIHMKSEGKLVVKEILNILKEADWEPCLHWKSLPNEFGEDPPNNLGLKIEYSELGRSKRIVMTMLLLSSDLLILEE